MLDENLIKQYQSDALRTHVDLLSNLPVYALGLSGEYWELEEAIHDNMPGSAQIVKESGDLLWYICASFHVPGSDAEFCRGIAWDVGQKPEIDLSLKLLGRSIGSYSDMIKKAVGHGHALDSLEAAMHLKYAHHQLNRLIVALGLDPATVMDANIAKLKARYPEGFSHERSVNRTS